MNDLVAAPLISRSTETYRYLRLSVVLLAVLLAASVVMEALSEDLDLRGSISAYFYSPVQNVFVGTLMAMGLGLLAIQGRDLRGEDILLNLAGMLATVVALVPTPVPGTAALPCPDGWPQGTACVPAAYVDGVDNNVRSLVVLGFVAFGVVLLFFRDQALRGRDRTLGYLAGVVALVGATTFYALDHDRFLRTAHYGAAIGMFGLLMVVAVLNAKAPKDDGRRIPSVPWLRDHFVACYVAVAAAIFAVALSVVGYLLVVPERDRADHWLLVVEALLLLLFAVFWVLQTVEFWYDGLPSEPGVESARGAG